MREEQISLRAGDALVVVDVQHDFLPGGSLAVPAGNSVIGPLNRYLGCFQAAGLPVYASRDWHPPDHCSFSAQGGPWPVHCVAGSPGARFAEELRLPADAVIISKDTLAGQSTYSAFAAGTELAARLRRAGISRLFIGGLATDYCVKMTVLDALKAGFEVLLLADAVRAVNVKPEDGELAMAAMQEHGARLITIERLSPGPCMSA